MKNKKSQFENFANYKFFPSQLSIAVEILRIYNCRSSEVLSAKWKDFDKDHFLILEGKKKSSNIIIRDRILLSAIEKLPHTDAVFIFPSLSYSILYHHCKKNFSHLFVKFKKRKNYKVTHGFRYEAVSKLDNETKIREVLHHRSTKSGKYYKLIKEVSRETSKKV